MKYITTFGQVLLFHDLEVDGWFEFVPATIAFHIKWRGKADSIDRSAIEGELFIKREKPGTFERVRDGRVFWSPFTEFYSIRPASSIVIRS